MKHGAQKRMIDRLPVDFLPINPLPHLSVCFPEKHNIALIGQNGRGRSASAGHLLVAMVRFQPDEAIPPA